MKRHFFLLIVLVVVGACSGRPATIAAELEQPGRWAVPLIEGGADSVERDRLIAVAANQDGFVVTGVKAGRSVVWSSGDGLMWREEQFDGESGLAAAASTSGFLVSGDEHAWISPDGVSWESIDLVSTGILGDLFGPWRPQQRSSAPFADHADGAFYVPVSGETSGFWAIDRNGEGTWLPSDQVRQVGEFYAAGPAGRLGAYAPPTMTLVQPDGRSLEVGTDAAFGPGVRTALVTATPEVYVAAVNRADGAANGATLWSSRDGTEWAMRESLGANTSVFATSAGEEGFTVVVAESETHRNMLGVSATGSEWEFVDLSGTDPLPFAVARLGGTVAVVGIDGLVVYQLGS